MARPATVLGKLCWVARRGWRRPDAAASRSSLIGRRSENAFARLETIFCAWTEGKRCKRARWADGC